MKLSKILSSVGSHWAQAIINDYNDYWLTNDGEFNYYVIMASIQEKIILELNQNKIGHHEEFFNGIETLMNDKEYEDLVKDFIEGLIYNKMIKPVDWLYLAGSTTCQYINDYFSEEI